MHDVGTGTLIPDLDAIGVDAGIGIHGTLIYLIIILKIPVGSFSARLGGVIKGHIIIHNGNLAV